MKNEKLKEISNEKFYVKNNMTYKKNIGLICNFHIVDITLYTKMKSTLSFEITLKNDKKATETCHFPISYLHDPVSWLYLGFDSNDFYIKSPKKEFESSMVEIINLIRSHKKHKIREITYGWDFDELPTDPFPLTKKNYKFGDFENPGEVLDKNDIKETPNILMEHMKLLDINIAAPLTCFMLLSLLTSLDFFGTEDIKPKFNMALVGGSATLRKKIALFFTNLYKRDPSFFNNDYELFHINKKDTMTEMRLKAALAKDCVLIVFEPDKRHLNVLLKEVYRTNSTSDNNSAPNLLLYTTEKYEKTPYENTIVVQLNDTHNTSEIEKYFNINPLHFDEITGDYNSPNMLDDYLKKNIYYYINLLTKKLDKHQNYIQKKFWKNHECFESLKPQYETETAFQAAELLFFGFKIYSKFFEFDDNFNMQVYNAIHKVVSNSFSTKPTETPLDKALDVCKQIDCYFSQKKSKNLIGEIGVETTPDEKRVWYDDNTIYMKLACVNEFLKLTGSELKLNISVRKTLADSGFIKSYIKKDNKPEYTVHLQKSLEPKTKDDCTTPSKSQKTRGRYIAFNRDICNSNGVFTNIENIIANK